MAYCWTLYRKGGTVWPTARHCVEEGWRCMDYCMTLCRGRVALYGLLQDTVYRKGDAV
jgi:hypothetical protein